LGRWSVVVRTCIIDDLMLSALAQGVDTVLNLGAGLDTRPYRVALPGSLRWIEVDYPHLIELKERRLSDEAPRCQLERVKLDLADVPARHTLLSTINSRSGTVLVLTEGVVPYLGVEDVAFAGAGFEVAR
jgi:methyltransferase (TIGR00027 family)